MDGRFQRGVKRKPADPAAIPLQTSKYRFSEQSLHADYKKEGTCAKCLTRVPYATLVATVMCLVGVGVFCGTMHRGATLTVIMLNEVFQLRAQWLEGVQLGFTSLGAAVGAIGLMILIVGVLATGATREKVYQRWGARVGGRVSCVIFMGLSYALIITWILILCFLVILTLLTTLSWGLCTSNRVQQEGQCIDLTEFDFLFPHHTLVSNQLKICEKELKLFCKDFVEKAEIMFILASVAAFLVILSLAHYLMCLSANYAHIRDHSKFQELQDLHYLAGETDMLQGSKDRF